MAVTVGLIMKWLLVVVFLGAFILDLSADWELLQSSCNLSVALQNSGRRVGGFGG